MKKQLLAMVGGMVISSVAKSSSVRMLAVNTLAKGMELKDVVVVGYNKLRAEAENIYEDAKIEARKKDSLVQEIENHEV